MGLLIYDRRLNLIYPGQNVKKKNVHRSEDQSGCRPTGGIERTMLGCLIRPYWDR
jgi:hypothetical protein